MISSTVNRNKSSTCYVNPHARLSHNRLGSFSSNRNSATRFNLIVHRAPPIDFLYVLSKSNLDIDFPVDGALTRGPNMSDACRAQPRGVTGGRDRPVFIVCEGLNFSAALFIAHYRYRVPHRHGITGPHAYAIMHGNLFNDAHLFRAASPLLSTYKCAVIRKVYV